MSKPMSEDEEAEEIIKRLQTVGVKEDFDTYIQKILNEIAIKIAKQIDQEALDEIQKGYDKRDT